VIIIYRLDAPKSILETEKTLKTLSSGQIYKKTKKNQKNPKKPQKKPKKPKKTHRAGLKKKNRVFPTLVLGGFGRRGPLIAYLLLSGAICVAIVCVKTFVRPPSASASPSPAGSWDAAGLVTGLALVGKAAIVSCFCTIFIYSSELFPTVIRSVGVGSCTFFGRVGSLLAPQVRSRRRRIERKIMFIIFIPPFPVS
jgi:hypothetical protein